VREGDVGLLGAILYCGHDCSGRRHSPNDVVGNQRARQTGCLASPSGFRYFSRQLWLLTDLRDVPNRVTEQRMAMVVRIGGLLALGLVVWTGCGTVVPTVPTPMAAVSVPSCPPNAGCGQGFAIGDRFYSFDCVRIRSNALQPAPHKTGNGVVEDVRGIVGLPTDAFLAVRGEFRARRPSRPSGGLREQTRSPLNSSSRCLRGLGRLSSPEMPLQRFSTRRWRRTLGR